MFECDLNDGKEEKKTKKQTHIWIRKKMKNHIDSTYSVVEKMKIFMQVNAFFYSFAGV